MNPETDKAALQTFIEQTLSQSMALSSNWEEVAMLLGFTAKASRLSQAKFECVDCGYSENADINAARNILAAGHAVLACGEIVQSGYSVKQEPAEVTTQITA